MLLYHAQDLQRFNVDRWEPRRLIYLIRGFEFSARGNSHKDIEKSAMDLFFCCARIRNKRSALRFIPLKFIPFDPARVSPRATHGILIETFLCRTPTAITRLAIRRFPISFPPRRLAERRRRRGRRATPCLPAGFLIRRVAWLARNMG